MGTGTGSTQNRNDKYTQEVDTERVYQFKSARVQIIQGIVISAQ